MSSGEDRAPRTQFRGELQPPPGFDSLVTAGLSVGGPVAIWSSRADESELRARSAQPPGAASFPETKSVTNRAVALAAYSDSGTAPTRVAYVALLGRILRR